jgi:hypothetical protein
VFDCATVGEARQTQGIAKDVIKHGTSDSVFSAIGEFVASPEPARMISDISMRRA